MDIRRTFICCWNLARSKCRRKWSIAKSCIFVSILLGVIIVINKLFETGNTPKSLPEIGDVIYREPFEPEVESEFPRKHTNSTLIPRILHQTWRDHLIPPKFVGNIKSFVKNNPDWEYFLWTDDNARRLIERHYPSILPVWDDYVETGSRQRLFNIIRYVAIYVYGGVYVDMDTFNHRPLDTVISAYDCILPPESFDRALVNHVPHTMTNAVLLCKPKHPFFKQVLDNLYHHMHLSNHWDAAGPGFLTTQYILYSRLQRKHDDTQTRVHSSDDKKDNSPYLFRMTLNSSLSDVLYVPNSQYFTGNLDKSNRYSFQEQCKNIHELHALHQKSCQHVRRSVLSGESKYTITSHFWQNNWYAIPQQYMYLYVIRLFIGTDIHNIVPHAQVL